MSDLTISLARTTNCDCMQFSSMRTILSMTRIDTLVVKLQMSNIKILLGSFNLVHVIFQMILFRSKHHLY